MEVIKERDLACTGNDFSDDLHPLPRDFRRIEKDPRHISAGPVKALCGSDRNGIGLEVKRNYRDCSRRLSRGAKTS
jgi:hypothetical protein